MPRTFTFKTVDVEFWGKAGPSTSTPVAATIPASTSAQPRQPTPLVSVRRNVGETFAAVRERGPQLVHDVRQRIETSFYVAPTIEEHEAYVPSRSASQDVVARYAQHRGVGRFKSRDSATRSSIRSEGNTNSLLRNDKGGAAPATTRATSTARLATASVRATHEPTPPTPPSQRPSKTHTSHIVSGSMGSKLNDVSGRSVVRPLGDRGRGGSQPPLITYDYRVGSTERRIEYRYHSETEIFDDDEKRKREQLEAWMCTQPIGIRRLEQKERQVAWLQDERDNIQKKTFTKWVNKHLIKTGRKVDDLFVDLRDGYSLIALLEALTGERIQKENGYTRFHKIQNLQYCLDFLKKKNIKVVNIRPEDIVEGNGKLTLGLIWTIILNFQVSVIRQRMLLEAQYELRTRSASSELTNAQVSEVLQGSEATSARDALLQWARKVTAGYPRVNVTNFSSSWRDGLAFNAILHRYRPNLIDWNKISDPSVSNRERLDNAFAAAEREFGVSRLLDAEDVDTDNPDEKSIITYVSSLYNALPHLPELSRGNTNDLISRLSRGIGITNEKLDLILKRIEDVEARIDTSPPGVIERTVSEIVEDLNLLEAPIAGFFEDVQELKDQNHPEANDFYQQVFGLHQRRTTYLDRLTNQILVRLGTRTDTLKKESQARLDSIRQSTFSRVEECIEWVRVRMEKLTSMEFLEDLETLEQIFDQHKLDNRDIQDFRQNVNECIARQSEVSVDDSHEYCELLRVLESEYQQLRDLSAGRMLDLDSLIAFVRAAQLELVWVSEREEIEVARNWSDIKQLDLPMLTNYYKQLLHEMELREKQYNDVHNQGAALLNQGHPAIHVIEVYLRTMQNQWDWLLALSKCLEEHLRDALSLKSFMEEAADAEAWMEEQSTRLENNYNRTDFSLEEGERFLRELDEIKEILNKYHGVLMALTERCASISPLWQRGERIPHPITVTALCDYSDKHITIKAGDDVVLLDNSDLIKWTVRDLSGVEGVVPSVVFRIPPPDGKLTAFLNRLLQQFEKLKKLWDKKHRMVRFNMVLNTMKTIQGWDLDTFNSIDPEQRDAIMRALNDDANKLLGELDPNDPLALRLREELRKTNEHFWNLLNASQRPPEPDWASQYDQKMAELLRKLEEAWRKLNDNVGKPVSRTTDDLERVIIDHKSFEDALQSLDGDVANVKELFRQLPNPTPTQRVNNDRLGVLWDDLWDLSRMYVERIKVLESVLNGMIEVADIVKAHEITLNSFDDLPAALDKLRGHHSQLLEINMVLKQQQTVIDQLNKNVALLRQHVARTRINEGHHPDIDAIEEEVQKLNVRWENVNAQIAERLITAERALQIQMIYRSEYETEMSWLDSVEETINRLRKPEELRPEQYQQQLDLLVAEYAQLQEHTAAIENVNKEGGRFIRDAKAFDAKMGQYSDAIVGVHGPDVRLQFRRTKPQPKNGAQIVTEELEALNRRFAQLSSLILERRNTMQVLIQNWKRQKQVPDINIPTQINLTNLTEDPDEWEHTVPVPDRAKMAEHEDEMQMYQEETVTKTQFYEMEGVLHKQTGEILTFVEAIRQGLLDLHSGGGQFFDLLSGSKISLEKAAELGYIDGGFQEVLSTQWGIHHPDSGESLTLLDAIQIGLYDPEIRQIRDINSREILSMMECTSKKIFNFGTMHKLIKMGILKLPPMSLAQAIEQGVLNTETGFFTGKLTKETMPIKDAIYHGYVQIVSSQQAPTIAITLFDAIENEFINSNNGEFNDRNTKDTFTLREATSKQTNLLNLNVPEIVNTADQTRLTLGEAVLRNAISTRNGNFTDLQSRRSLSLNDAYREELICKPLTLTEASARDLIDSTGHFVDRGSKQRHTLLAAVASGLIDAEVRHLVDPEEKDVISIAEALERGLLSANGKVVIEKQSKEYTIPEAVREGLLTRRVRHSIFDVKGIRNNLTGQNMSFNEAVEAGAIIPNAERVVDLATQESYLMSDSKATRIVDSALHELLTKSVGIKGDHGDFDMNLVRAVSKGIIDPTKGVFFNKNTKQELSAREAYNHGLVSLRGAMQLAALFDVPPSLASPTKKIDKKKRISRPGQSNIELASDQVKVTIAEAMKRGIIDSRTQRFRQDGVEMSLDDALSRGLIDPASEWIVPARTKGAGPTIEEKTTETITETGQQLAPKFYPDKNIEESVTTVKRVRTTETTALGGPGGVSVYRAITGGKGALEVPASGYHIYEAERKGLIDLTSGQISAPNVDRTITFAEGVELGIIEAASISVRDPKTGRQIGVKEALEKNAMNKDGSVTINGRPVNIERAIEEKHIIIEAEPLVPYNNTSKNIIQIPSGSGPIISFRPVGQPVVEESEQSWEFDAHRGVLIDHLSGDRMTLDQALSSGKLAPEDLSVCDALTGREMTFVEAEKWGIIDSKRGFYLDKSDNKRLSFTEAAQQHRVYPTGGVPDNAADAVHTTMKIQTRTQVAKKEALSSGVPLSENTLGKALALGWYEAASGKFTHPDTQKQMTLKESIIKGLFNPYDTTIVDKRNNKEVSMLEAIQLGIVDDTAGTVENTQTGQKLDLTAAVNAGLVKGKNFGDSLDSSIFSGRLDIGTGHYMQPAGGSVPLHEALKTNLVDHSSVVVRDPSTGTEYSYKEAVSRRIVDPDRGLIHNHSTNEATSFPQALTTGLLASSSSNQRPSTQSSRLVEQKLQLTPFAPHQISKSGDGRHEFVDLGGGKQVRVKVVKGEGGVEKGEYVDPSTGMKFTIQMHGDPFVTETKTSVKSTSQVQSIELEPHAEFVGIDRIRDKRNNRVMSLEDAKRIGLAKVDKKGKQMTRTYQVFRSAIQNAVNKGVKDAHDEKISLEDAIRMGIVDIRNLTYRHPKSGDSIALTQAANMGLIDVTLSEILPKGICHPGTNENISLHKAIDLGIVDARTGEVRDPRTRERLTWLDILRTVYQAITTDGVFDPTKGHHVPVTSALNDGLINPTTGNYHNVITGEDVPLSDAVERGLIDRSTYETITKPSLTDYRSNRQLNLIEAVRERIIDPKNRTIQLSRQSIVPIAKAVQDGRIPQEIGEKLRRVDKLAFAEAVGKGLIDAKSNIFTDPDTGRQLTIAQAIEQGFIDTGSVEGLEGNEEKNLANVVNSSEFDENSGRIRDKKTGLYLTFRDAVDRGVIDGESLLHDQNSDELMTLRDALSRKKIDQDGKYIDGNSRLRLSDAVKSGRITLIASPSEAVQAVTEAVKRRDAEGYKFKIQEYEDERQSRASAPRYREETTVTRLTPQKGDPGLSVRMRQSTTTTSDRARSFVDDPSSMADLHHEFLSNLEANKFDTDERVIENPKDGQRISVREAAETGLLDVLTGEIVHPETGRRYSIPRAVHMKLVSNDAARRLMEGLNMPLEEVHMAQTSHSSHRSPSPGTYVSSHSSVQPTADGGQVTTREFTKTINWQGQPSELRKSKTDPLAPYTTVTSSADEPTHDAPSWARRE